MELIEGSVNGESIKSSSSDSDSSSSSSSRSVGLHQPSASKRPRLDEPSPLASSSSSSSSLSSSTVVAPLSQCTKGELLQTDALSGKDSEGKIFASPDEFWRSVLHHNSTTPTTATTTTRKRPREDVSIESDGVREAASEKQEEEEEEEEEVKPVDTTPWYSKSDAYWKNVEPTVDGVLGGFGFLSPIDIRTSRAFIARFLSPLPPDAPVTTPTGTTAVLDCGAGIGRITKELLLDIFERVDLIEPNATFLDTARRDLSNTQHPKGHKAEKYFCSALQDFAPERNTYDVIWLQWVIGYLTDVDFVALLKRFKQSLKPNGIIVVKDNVTRESFYVDKEDSSVTR
eukprot:TRINITY_DN8214_c0_g1_i1.p1 TRINITY_DN8214_c0_g1~~TRINITY_DN8214_c0_g1_i1.p1  ORF type:complete len:343 (-),score=77.47 TRINITY_DN8214_c0_g1_i1:1023-2051(-)